MNTIIGRVTKNAEINTLTNDKQVVNFSVAINDWLRKFYRSKKRALWTNGYFCSTVGRISEETVFEYIENQGKNHYDCN